MKLQTVKMETLYRIELRKMKKKMVNSEFTPCCLKSQKGMPASRAVNIPTLLLILLFLNYNLESLNKKFKVVLKRDGF